MSDDDRDIDVESDDGDDSDTRQSNVTMPTSGNQYYSQAEKRAHHNALERKRRDHIKDSFSSLRDTVPALSGEKASRAQILKKAAEYIVHMRRKNSAHQKNIEDLSRQNQLLEKQITVLGNFKEKQNIDGHAGTTKSPKEVQSNIPEEDPAPKKKTKRVKPPRH